MIQEGWYKAEIRGAEEKLSRTGKPMIQVKYWITGGQQVLGNYLLGEVMGKAKLEEVYGSLGVDTEIPVSALVGGVLEVLVKQTGPEYVCVCETRGIPEELRHDWSKPVLSKSLPESGEPKTLPESKSCSETVVKALFKQTCEKLGLDTGAVALSLMSSWLREVYRKR